MIKPFIFFLWCQLQISDTQFNLYHTDKNSIMSTADMDCLYCNPYELSSGLVPFCIRSNQFDDEDKASCYGTTITFKQLKTNNITTDDLFHWNAIIQIIDLYEKYLQFPHLVNDNEVYCNCSNLTRFGKYCQYFLDTEDYQRNFNDLIGIHRRLVAVAELYKKYSTCYIGLQCQINLVCLDWRQICNGIVDCDHGEDEPTDLCLQVELNQCHPEEEFRCQNGLCIPITTVSTVAAVCSDLSDEKNILHTDGLNFLSYLCLEYPSLECDEINLAWKQFSCFNGLSIPYSDLTSKIGCKNDYHLTYLRKLFSTKNESECWKSMICLTGFHYLYSHLNCSNRMNIEESCPNEFYFPSNSIVYSFVFFLYEKNDRIDWFKYTGPNSICYQKEFCPNYTFSYSTFSKNNLTCFPVDQTNFSWKNFYEYIVYLFSPCFTSSIEMNHPMLYQCNRSQSFISIYRVKDKSKDCFFNEDEDENINVCSLNTNDQFKCLTNQQECIRQFLLSDNAYDCADGTDEYFRGGSPYADRASAYHPVTKRTLPEIYRFDELCDYVVDHHLFSLESNETDEINCEHWPYQSCSSYYTRCNEIWNCPDGSDEINCGGKYSSIAYALNCQSNEHYCIKLMNHSDANPTCININQTGDGIIDCIGGTDERFTSICIEKYPTEFQRRFHCMNSTLCIRLDQICNRINDCPFHDDELICPWLFQSNSSTFYCKNSPSNPIDRCDTSWIDNEYCQMREHLWFCDLELESGKTHSSLVIPIGPYPPVDENIKSVSFPTSDLNQLLISEKRKFSLVLTNPDPFSCNFGYSIKSSILNNKTYCLCPPSYYGNRCQYQSERVTVSLQLQLRYSMNLSTVFRLMVYLLDENNLIISYDQVVFNHVFFNLANRFLIYLLSERVTNLSLHQRSKSKFVRIDSYIINTTNVQYISSWFFSVSFPFLPVNRLAADLRLVNESFKVIYCKKKCGLHGKCLHYINAKDKEYCWCDQGWFGENCQLKSSSCNTTTCSLDSQCMILNEDRKQIKCICPLGKSGDQCYIKHNACFNNPCLDNGTCLPLDERTFGYVCICHDINFGPDCGFRNDWSHISIDTNLTELSTIPTIINIFGHEMENKYSLTSRVLYKDVILPAIIGTSEILSQFEFIQMFHNFSSSFYYIVSIQREFRPYSMNRSVISENLCPNVSELFNQTILNEYSYLKRLKLYHLPCKENHNLRCFHDQYRMCMCTEDHNSHCFFYNHEYGRCNYCQNGGLCIQEDPFENPWNFVCLCSRCTYGSLCQFAPANYFITFDMLIGIDMKTEETSFSKQPTIIHLTLVSLIFVLIISFILNTISTFVFSNKKLRQVGCDLYLLYLTIISEIGLVLLFLRFIYMIIIQMYIIENLLFVQISCILLEYLVRLIPSLFDWLTVCISIERAYTVIKDVQFTRVVAAKTLKLSRWIILIVVVVNILTTLHRPFYLRLFDELTMNDEPRGHPWCVLDFDSISWNVYEKFITIFHLILPFILNLLSVIGFILYKIKLELTSTTKRNKDGKFIVIKKQLLKYKPLVISPLVTLILEIPRFVLTFTLACIDHDWQRYVYLIGYLISFCPLTGILFIYIVPSPKYKEELQTIIKKTFRRSLF